MRANTPIPYLLGSYAADSSQSHRSVGHTLARWPQEQSFNLVFSGCFSVAVREHHDQTQLAEARVYSGFQFQRDKSPSWKEGKAVSDHVFNINIVNRKWDEAMNSQGSPPVTPPAPQCHTTSPNSATNWRPRIQIPESMNHIVAIGIWAGWFFVVWGSKVRSHSSRVGVVQVA